MNVSDQEDMRVVEALRNIGMNVLSVYDLVNTSDSYPMAIPTLLELLKGGIMDDKVKEGVVRALAVKEARGIATKPLIDEFLKTSSDKMSLKWAIGNTIGEVAIDSDFDELASLVRDKSHGDSRQMIVASLGRIKHPQTEKLLIELLHDDEVAAHAVSALSTKKSVRALAAIEPLVDHHKPLVRKTATKAVKRLRKGIRDRESN